MCIDSGSDAKSREPAMAEHLPTLSADRELLVVTLETIISRLKHSASSDSELDAMFVMLEVLHLLSDDKSERVLNWVTARMGCDD